MEQIGAVLSVLLIVGVVLWGCVRGVPVFDCFLAGAEKGARFALRLLPTLIGLLVAVQMLRVSGFFALLGQLLAPVLQPLGIDPQLIPLFFLRPISGSGALSYAGLLYQTAGADSETARTAAILTASTETTFYALTVYFGASGYKKLRYAVPAALVGDCTAVVLSLLLVRFFY